MAARFKDKSWPYPAFELLTGKQKPERILTGVGKLETLCEANFYSGEWYLLKGDKVAASKQLERATLGWCRQRNHPIYSAAAAELKRLKP